MRITCTGLALLLALTLLPAAGCGTRIVVTHSLPRAPQVATGQHRPGHVWVGGHYSWRDGRYVWVNGRYERVREGRRWVSGHYGWQRVGPVKVKVWVPGHWVSVKGSGSKAHTPAHPPKAHAKIVVVDPPSRPKVKRPRRPSKHHQWVPGHHAWKGGAYVWVPGHWQANKPKKRWVEGRYRVEVRGHHKVKIWVPGHWK